MANALQRGDAWAPPPHGSARAWVRGLDAWLRSTSGDPHLAVRIQPEPRAPQDAPVDELEEAFRPDDLAAGNFGFRRAEILDDGIGVLDIRVLAPLDVARATARAALDFVSHARALVFDLRRCAGGSSDMVAFLAGHVLGGCCALSSLLDPGRGVVLENRTLGSEGPPSSVPLAMLVGRGTASAAEALAYDLRRLARGIVIGAPTRGAAHAIETHRIHPRVRLLLPYARAVDPDGQNWHRIGVPRDIEVPENEAMAAAQAWLRRC